MSDWTKPEGIFRTSKLQVLFYGVLLAMGAGAVVAYESFLYSVGGVETMTLGTVIPLIAIFLWNTYRVFEGSE
jgi:hypothetical protein